MKRLHKWVAMAMLITIGVGFGLMTLRAIAMFTRSMIERPRIRDPLHFMMKDDPEYLVSFLEAKHEEEDRMLATCSASLEMSRYSADQSRRAIDSWLRDGTGSDSRHSGDNCAGYALQRLLWYNAAVGNQVLASLDITQLSSVERARLARWLVVATSKAKGENDLWSPACELLSLQSDEQAEVLSLALADAIDHIVNRPRR
ncbi:MAG: hypothetical protein KF805_14130 [Phycisphaeraceae bacterium]|nr:hypothetical protein [Phycisphaeraceae bacterium]